MSRNARRMSSVVLSLGLLIGEGIARADLTPVSSSFALTAKSQAGLVPIVSSTDSQSQGSTIDPLSVAVSAYSTYSGFDASLLVTGNGVAKWTNTSQGEVSFTNVGWTGVRANGVADIATNTGWTYTFTTNVTGSFVIDYTVTAQGTSSTTSSPLFGLNGFFIYGGLGAVSPTNPNFSTGLNTSGTFLMDIVAGNTYTVQIQCYANLHLGIGTTDAHMDGIFDFDVQPLGVQPVPEPSSMSVTIIISVLVGGAIALKRRQFLFGGPVAR